MKSPEERVRTAEEALWRRFPMLRPAAPPRLPEQGRLILGRDKDGAPFPLNSRLLASHIDMVGGTGAGKSATMRHLAWSHMESHPKFNRATVIIDPHGGHQDSLSRTTLRRVVQTKLYERKRVYVIDANSEWCAGLRLLDGTADACVMADHMIEAFERFQNDQSLMETPTLRRALHGLLAVLAELKWSLAEADLLLDRADRYGVREWALGRITDRYATKALLRLQYLSQDPRLYKEFEIETIGTENRMAPVLSSPAMRAIAGSQTIDMRDVLDEGAVLLVNTAGGNAASEIAGDLLGKLVMRALLFAAKRRRTNSLAMIFADECARYVSQDWERALAEFRKFSCCLCSAHQTFAMLGKPDDPVRQAIEKIPATKIALRLNSMQEATEWAPELMRLNLEMPVDALTKPVVVGHKKTWLNNESSGISGGIGNNLSAGSTSTQSVEVGESAATTKGRSYTKTYSSETTVSESETDEENWSESDSLGETRLQSHSEDASWGASDVGTESEGYSSGRNGAVGASENRTAGTGSSRSYDRENLPENRLLSSGAPSGGTESKSAGASWARSTEQGWDEQRSGSRSNSHSASRGGSSSDAESTGASWEHSETRGGGHSRTVGRADTTGESDAHGTSEAETVGQSRNTGTAHSISKNAGLEFSVGISQTVGRSEALEPILKDLPGGVHSLENVRHMAAEMLCTLPDGVAVVRTVHDGRIEGAVVRVPYRRCAPITDEQYAADLSFVMQRCGASRPMCEALRHIEERERLILKEAQALRLPPPEPESFRVPAPKPNSVFTVRSHAKLAKAGAQAVQGGPSAVAKGERDP